MTVLQKQIKKNIEKEFKEQCDETLIVEFVSNVSESAYEITSKSKMKFVNSYDGGVQYGIFIPPIHSTDTYHILIWNGLKESREFMTSAHELEHAKLYVNMLRTVFENDCNKLNKSFLNEYFQVFSEFSAYRKGMENYLRNVTFDGYTQEDVAIALLEEKLEFYQQNIDKSFKQSRLMYNSILAGSILGALDVVKSKRVLAFLDELDSDEHIKKVYNVMYNYKDEKDWYTEYSDVVDEYYWS